MSSVCQVILTDGAVQVGAEVAPLLCNTVPFAPSVSSTSLPLASLYIVFQAPFQVRSCPALVSLVQIDVFITHTAEVRAVSCASFKSFIFTLE